MPSSKQLKNPLLPDPGNAAAAPPHIQRSASDPTSFQTPPIRLIRAQSDPVLVQLLSAPRINKADKYKVIRNGFVTFFALVLYQHAIYDMLTFYLHFTDKGIYSAGIVLGCTLLMVLSRSLESLITYDSDQEIDDTIPSHFCLGFADKDLRYLGNIDCTILVWKYRFYLLRIFKYNFNATLISAVWVGGDNFLGYLQWRITDYEVGPRLMLNIFLLLVSNVILIAFGQLSGQFGVYDDNAVIVYKSPENNTAILKYMGRVPPVTPNSTPETSPTASGQSSGPSSPRYMPEPPPSKRPFQLDIPTQFKMVATLFAMVLYWYALWDIFAAMPTEEIVVQANEGDDAADDDGREHRSVSKRLEYIFLTVGIGYVISSGLVLVVSGELFAFINREEDDEVQEVLRDTEESVSSRLERIGVPASLSLDVVWKCGDKLFLPIRLIEYNMLGIFGVIAWIGMEFILLAIANLAVYDKHASPEARYSLDMAYIIFANILLTWTKEFGNQFGGDARFASEHEIYSIEPSPNEIKPISENIAISMEGRDSEL